MQVGRNQTSRAIQVCWIFLLLCSCSGSDRTRAKTKAVCGSISGGLWVTYLQQSQKVTRNTWLLLLGFSTTQVNTAILWKQTKEEIAMTPASSLASPGSHCVFLEMKPPQIWWSRYRWKTPSVSSSCAFSAMLRHNWNLCQETIQVRKGRCHFSLPLLLVTFC